MKNVYKNIDQLKEKIAKDKEHDYLDIYSESDNIELANTNDNFKLYSRLSRTVSIGNKRKAEGFFYNKDAGMYVCPEGHMAIRKAVNGKKKHKEEGKTMVETYFFDIEKCKMCHADIADNLTTSLHYTGRGMMAEYTVGAGGEFGIDMDVFYEEKGCTNCHVTACSDCHGLEPHDNDISGDN